MEWLQQNRVFRDLRDAGKLNVSYCLIISVFYQIYNVSVPQQTIHKAWGGGGGGGGVSGTPLHQLLYRYVSPLWSEIGYGFQGNHESV